MQLQILVLKINYNWPCHVGWMFVGWKICVNRISMWLSFQLNAMSCLLCYMIRPRWLEEIAVACGIYDWKKSFTTVKIIH
jgi:hypothetical protein